MLKEQYYEKAESFKRARKLWNRLDDIPVNDVDDIEEEFEHFEIGTSKFDIWNWFEEEFDLSVSDDLMNLKLKQELL